MDFAPPLLLPPLPASYLLLSIDPRGLDKVFCSTTSILDHVSAWMFGMGNRCLFPIDDGQFVSQERSSRSGAPRNGADRPMAMSK